jgi:hypothetical protein
MKYYDSPDSLAASMRYRASANSGSHGKAAHLMSSASKQRSYRGASAKDIISGSGYIADRPHGATTSGGAGPEILGQILQLVAKIAGVICKGA